MLFWNANPILVQLGPIAVHWYGALFAAGFLLGYQLM
jgi:prolipoprotein diacylglyceryltransferase